MAQEICVLRCVSCETFQSQIVKKTSNWECKVCGTKQSIKKVYGRGSGKDCRLHTQKLNALKGETDTTIKNKYENFEECLERQPSHMTECKNLSVSDTELCDFSKWDEYIDEEQLSVSKKWNHKKHKISNDFHLEQSTHDKTSIKRPLHPPIQANLIQIENKICYKKTKKNIDFKDKVIKTQSKEEKVENPSVKWEKYLNGKKYEECLTNSTVTSLTLFPTKLRVPEKNTNITPKQQSNKELLVSFRDFECNLNLIDVDFQLDF